MSLTEDQVNIEIIEDQASKDLQKNRKKIVNAIVEHEEKIQSYTPQSQKLRSPVSPESPLSPESPDNNSSIFSHVGNNDDQDHEVFNLASIIFTHADLDHDGSITLDEFIESTRLSQKISKAILRCMNCKDNCFKVDSLYLFIKTLKLGSLEKKVQLLHSFMDEDGNGGVNEEEFNELFNIKNPRINARLGFGSPGYELTYENLLNIFQNSNKGNSSINTFCSEILKILSKAAIENIRDRKRQNIDKKSERRSYYGYIVEKVIKFCKYCIESKQNRFLTVLVLLQLFLWLYYFCHYYVDLGNPEELAIAKGFGLNLRILSVLMFFTMCRSTLGNLYLVDYLEKIIPVGINLEIHSFLGFSMLFHSIGHVFAHISYEYIRTKGGPTATVLQKSLTNGGWANRVPGGDGITGYILLGIILFISISAVLRKVSSFFYALFYHIHIIGYILYLTFIYLHVYSLWPWWLAILVLYIGDKGYDLLFLTTISNLSLSRPGPDGITFLSVYSKNHPEAGSYYRIKVPALSHTEWHSFSFVGNASSNHLKFFVTSTGDWSTALFELVSDPSKRDNATVLIQGPFAGPASKLFRTQQDKKVFLVANGIGIAPHLSCIATDVANALNAESNRDTFDALFHIDYQARKKSINHDDNMNEEETRNLHVIWTLQEIQELAFFIEYIFQLIKLQDQIRHKVVTVDIYLTGLGQLDDPSFLIAHTFLSLLVGERETENMNIIYSSPNFEEIIVDQQPSAMYFCGSQDLSQKLESLCTTYNVNYIPESFDSDGGILYNEIKSYVNKVFGKYCGTSKDSHE